ncbi:RCC1 domain-containing protein [Kitasatospora aureofaciens]|uniref:RCC1 domain-containing protein n=1 Tax=Kitasatospora aureofaciens TaxID=1894 RepID=UPI0037CB9641
MVQEKQLKAWGNNRGGQLGNGSWGDFSTAATAVLGLTSAEVVKISAGGEGPGTGHGLALLSDGTVQSWGASGSGQLGDGSTFGRNTPGQVAGLSNATAIAAGGAHSVALLADKTVVAWGKNGYGQLGNRTNSDSSTPVRVEGLDKVIAVAVGLNYSLALREDGTVWAWGHNTTGQLGDGTTTSRNAPTPVAGLTGVTRIAAGTNHSLALVGSTNKVMAWGENTNGQLGDGTPITRYAPVEVALGADTVSLIAAGGSHSMAVTGSDKRLSTWGQNTSGQLGDGTTDGRYKPVTVPGLTGVRLAAGGREHTVVVLADGTVRSWGANSSGQLADGTRTNSSTPVTSQTGLTGVDKIAAPAAGDFTIAN